MYQNIIITGASNGLGMALASRYAAPGVYLGLIGRNNERTNEIASLCRDKGAAVESVSLDIRDREGLRKWITTFDDSHPVDLVIASAGVMYSPKSGHLIEQKATIDEIMDVNFTGVIDTVIPLLERMGERKKGSVAVISSLSAYHGIPTFPAYSASKAAVKTYFEAIRGLYARQGVYISIVCPSYVDTSMTAPLKLNKLLMMGLDTAVDRIQKGIARRKPLINFPWYHSLVLWLLRLLPERLGDRILLLFLGK